MRILVGVDSLKHPLRPEKFTERWFGRRFGFKEETIESADRRSKGGEVASCEYSYSFVSLRANDGFGRMIRSTAW